VRVAQNPLRCHRCKRLNLRGHKSHGSAAHKQVFVGGAVVLGVGDVRNTASGPDWTRTYNPPAKQPHGSKLQMPYRPLLAEELIPKPAPQLGYTLGYRSSGEYLQISCRAREGKS